MLRRSAELRANGPCSRRKVRVLALVLTCAAGAACASRGSGVSPAEPITVLPAGTAFEGGRGGFGSQPSAVLDTVLAAPRSRVWSVLPDALARLGVEASTIDARSFLMGNESWTASMIEGTRLSAFWQCGSGVGGPNVDRYEVTLGLLVQLESRGSGATLVRTVVDAHARPRDRGGQLMQCASLGTLERRVVSSIREGLEAPEGSARRLVVAGALPGRARVPVVGDYIRLECSAGLGGMGVREGPFLGVGDGGLLLGLDRSTGMVSVPVAGVSRVQVRERRSRAGVGMAIGTLLGIAGGALVGYHTYDRAAENHYSHRTHSAVGGLLGGVAGAALGRLVGSLFDRDLWLDAPTEWIALQASPRSVPPATGQAAPACSS